MKTYGEFMTSLTGTDPVADAREVRKYVGSTVSRDWALDMHDAFRGLLIDSLQGRQFTELSRYGERSAFMAEVSDYDYREGCARLVGVWVLNRNKVEIRGLNYNTVSQEDRDYVYAFAMELIIPEEMLRERLKFERLSDICDRFGVPAGMLYRRMQGLDLL